MRAFGARIDPGTLGVPGEVRRTYRESQRESGPGWPHWNITLRHILVVILCLAQLRSNLLRFRLSTPAGFSSPLGTTIIITVVLGKKFLKVLFGGF